MVCGYVIKSVMCVSVQCVKTCCFWYKFDIGGHFLSKGNEICFFTLISIPPYFKRQLKGKMKSRCPKRRGKTEVAPPQQQLKGKMKSGCPERRGKKEVAPPQRQLKGKMKSGCPERRGKKGGRPTSTTTKRKNEIRMPGTQGKKGRRPTSTTI